MRHAAVRVLRKAIGACALGLGLGAVLASCGAGTAAIVGGSSGDSGSANDPTTVGSVRVLETRTSPVRVSFTLFDRESNPARVRLRYLTPGAVLAQGHDLLPVAGPDLDQVPASPLGEVTTVEWDFETQLGSAAFAPGLTVVVTVNGADDLVSLGNAALVDVGNDVPEVLGVTVPAPSAEVGGLVAIPIEVRDQGDALDLTIQFEGPGGVWLPARPAGLAPGTPTPAVAMEDVPSDDDGFVTTFVWDSAADLPGTDATIRMRVAADDGLAATDFRVTSAFPLDNNARPSVRLLDASLVVSTDQREGLSLPFVVTDAESDPIDVVLQWKVAGAVFPPLALEPEALRAVLADPVRRRELQIVSERPLVHEGRVGRLPAGLDPLRHVRLPELGRGEIHALARGLAGRVLEFPRGLVPHALGDSWSEHVLVRPVAALPMDDALGALVLDEPAPGTWRLLALELESGALQRLVASGAGSPRALAADAGEGWLVGVEHGADFELLWIAGDGTLRGSLQGSDFGLSGPLRGLASRASGVCLASAGSALLEGHFEAANTRLTRLLDGLAEPWGVVVDPENPAQAFVALHGAGEGGVSVVDLGARVARPLRTEAPGLPRPTALALDRAHQHLYALTDADPGDGLVELRGVHLDGPQAHEPFTISEELPAGAASLALGARDLRLVALPETDELAAGGGVHARRTIVAGPEPEPYERARQIAAVEPPLRTPPAPGSAWRLVGTLGAARSGPEGVLNLLLWDLPADFTTDADVVIRAIPLDRDVGTLDESIVSKRASVFGFDQESAPLELDLPFAVTDADEADLVLADFDGDGLEDLVTTASRSDLIAFFRQTDGAFSSTPERVWFLSDGASPQDLACGDLDGDGLEDLLVACGGLGSVAVYFQGPLGLPDEPSLLLALDGNPRKLALADLDLDGRTDVLVACTGTNDIRLFTRGAGGSFVLSPDRLRFFSVEPGDLAAGDVDGDGDVDVVAARRDTGAAWLFERRPDGSYPVVKTHVFDVAERINTQLLLEDLNGDGISDLVCVSNGVLDFFGAGLGSIAVFYLDGSELPPEPHGPDVILPIQAGQGVALHDLDGNGERDLVVAQQSYNLFIPGGLRVYLQRDGVFEHHLQLDTRDHVRVIIEDLGADGSEEILTLGSPGDVRIWRASSGGLDLDTPDALLATPCVPFGGACRLVEAGDFNGDGLIDLLEHSELPSPARGELRIRLQEGPRLFEAQPSLAIPSAQEFAPFPPRSADLDGDGRLDLVTRITGEGYRVQYQRGTGEEPSFAPGPLLADADVELLGIEDFDGDGRCDLAFLSQTSSISVSIHLAGALGAFAEAPDLVLPISSTDTYRGQLADVNADGRPDLFLTGSGLLLQVYLGVEGALLATEPSYSVADLNGSLSLQTLLVDDLDRDGLPDLLFGLEGELAVFFQRRDGFPALSDLRVPISDVLALQLGDFEGDGDLDVLGQSFRPASGNDLAGLFAFPWSAHRRLGLLGTAARGTLDTTQFVVTDIDLDGSLDAVTSGSGVVVHYGR
jgi:hypothetical protein